MGCIIISPPVPAVAFNGHRIAWIFTCSEQLFELLGRNRRDREGSAGGDEVLMANEELLELSKPCGLSRSINLAALVSPEPSAALEAEPHW